ncbi:MAG: NAD(P)H-dependent oxidoreductase subunit E [Candidatus Acidulodesulfobacterium sp.]
MEDKNTSLIISSLIKEAEGRHGALFHILSGINEKLGYIPDDSILQISESLNISRAEVYGFLSFFNNYNRELSPVANTYRKIVVCRSESCEAAGSKKLIEYIKTTLNIDFGKFSQDGKYFLDYVYCFGHCAASPAIEIDDILYEKVTTEFFDEIIKDLETNKFESPIEVKSAYLVKHLNPIKSLIFNRAESLNPLSITDYVNSGGFVALKKIIESVKSGEESVKQFFIDELKRSKLKGRGGAGFPAGIKWETVFKEKSDAKYIICNADEGDSGAYADRIILENDPFSVIEGMIIAGLITGAEYGCIYLRAEYAAVKSIIEKALKVLNESGYLGDDILGSGFNFYLDLIVGAGSYVCGEETALMESIENKRGTVRQRPPVPAVSGLYGKPTVINNVLTFAYASYILQDEHNLETFLSLGTDDSKGTMPFQVSGAVNNPGIFELPFGITLRELLNLADIKNDAKAVQIGGPLGAYFPLNEEFLNLNLSYESVSEKGGLLGHGGIVVFGSETDFIYRLLNALDFFIDESCGKCAPCRIGTVRLKELFERVLKKQNAEENLKIIDEILESMKYLSLCAFGAGVHIPVRSLLNYFKNEIIK